jgi:hypothetical protein
VTSIFIIPADKASTLKLYGAKVLTKDEKIAKCDVVEVAW